MSTAAVGARPTPSSLVEQSYALWLWLDERVVDWPSHAKPALGRAVLTTALALLDQLTRASFTPRREAQHGLALREANHRVAFLRLLLRGARERRFLSPAQHTFASERLEAIGRGVGAWRKVAVDAP